MDPHRKKALAQIDNLARSEHQSYSVFATGGREFGLRQETLDLLAVPAVAPARGFLRRMHEKQLRDAVYSAIRVAGLLEKKCAA